MHTSVQECNEGKWKEAAETAATAPNHVLRTQATVTRLQAAPAVPGQKSPLLMYFGALLGKGTLNGIESVEMARIAISQNKPDLVTNWMKEGKLTASEPLGDLLKEVWLIVSYIALHISQHASAPSLLHLVSAGARAVLLPFRF